MLWRGEGLFLLATDYGELKDFLKLADVMAEEYGKKRLPYQKVNISWRLGCFERRQPLKSY
jgi:hypothetical protein